MRENLYISIMAKIQIPSDCGNAPRRLFLKNMYIALANGDLDFITSTIPEEISWETVGKKTVTGKKDSSGFEFKDEFD